MALGRVLTPEDDPFARFQSVHVEGHDTRSDTPRLLSPGPENYSFPPSPVSQCFSAKPSSKQASVKVSPSSRYSPPKGPPPSDPLPRLPPPKRPIPPAPKDQDWTLSLSGPTSPIKGTKSMSLRSRGKTSSSQSRPDSPFPLVDYYSQNPMQTPPELEPLSPADEFIRPRYDSEQSTVELQSDAEWPLPPKRTITVGETTPPEDGFIKRGRSINRGWHDVVPTSEVIVSHKSSQNHLT
jgi:hypothetical protein